MRVRVCVCVRLGLGMSTIAFVQLIKESTLFQHIIAFLLSFIINAHSIQSHHNNERNTKPEMKRYVMS